MIEFEIHGEPGSYDANTGKWKMAHEGILASVIALDNSGVDDYIYQEYFLNLVATVVGRLGGKITKTEGRENYESPQIPGVVY